MKHRRWILLILLYVALLLAGWAAERWFPILLQVEPEAFDGPSARMMILTTLALFIIFSALPFVPGAEIGFGLIMLLGTNVLGLVYISMVTALTLSYLVGRFIPIEKTAAAFRFFGLTRASKLALDMAPLSPEQRLSYLTEKSPKRILPFILRYRYATLFVILNVPGNTLIGGGGGIALVAGLSGIIPFPAYFLTVLLAVAPLPLVIFITGSFI